jgi:hypothetical protein
VENDGTVMRFKTAGGGLIVDEGRKSLFGYINRSDALKGARFRSGKFSRALMAVTEMVDSNMRVVFDKVDGIDTSHFVDKRTGETFKMDRGNKVYEVEFDVVPHWEAQRAQQANRRQARL